jgi:hypothetical protein
MSVPYGKISPLTERRKKMTVGTKTYQVGDLFTTQKSKVTGVIKKIEPITAETTRVLLDVDGTERWTSVTIN